MKICNNCKETKPLNAFYKEKGMKDGHRSECKDCRDKKTYDRRNANPDAYNTYMQQWRQNNPEAAKAIENKRYQNPARREYALSWSKKQKESGYGLYRLYGITKEQRFNILKKQEGKCAICSKHESELRRGLFVDHCHASKKVRGLLCDSCNKTLGHAKDSEDILTKAAIYIAKNK